MWKSWNEKDKKKKKKKMSLCLCLCMSVVGLFCLMLAARCAFSSPRYVLSKTAVDGSYELPLAAPPEEKNFRLQINPYPHLNLQTGKCNLMLENAEENQWNIYVLLRTEDTKETLYISPVLKPGERVAYAKFDKIPDTGECAVVAEFYMMDPENKEVAGGTEAGLLLTISEGSSVLR